ncbi:MAG: complex I subunit 1 family protein [Anaerolineae bacterium]
MDMLAQMLVFPGAAYLFGLGMLLAWLDRRIIAVLQGRVGPPVYQPLADFLKLLAKEDITTVGTDSRLAGLLPVVSLACTLTAGLLVPVGNHAIVSFEGDLVVALFLLSMPTLGLFLAGIIVPSVYNVLGGSRALLQYLNYEVPLLLGLAAPAAYARTAEMTTLMQLQQGYRWHILAMPLGFVVATLGLIGKLERLPLDAPHAKAEIGAGPLTEYSGRKLALWSLGAWVQTVVCINLIVAVYLGGADQIWAHWGFPVYIVKIAAYMGGLALVQVLYARLRVDQVAELSWRLLVPLGLAQLLAALLIGA